MSVEIIISQEFEKDDQSLSIVNRKFPDTNTGETTSFSPLSYGQQALWFLYQMAPESVAYNTFNTALIYSRLDIKAWRRAWKKIVSRHPILRTTYTTNQGQPFQVVHQKIKLPAQEIDAFQWTEDKLKQNILVETDRVFNLEKEPAWRVTLFTRSEREHIFLLTMHHIATDLWSYDLLFTELQLWYAAETEQLSHQQVEDSLPKNRPYANFVRWQSEMLSGSKAEKHWEYWQKQLSGDLPILNLPTDRPRQPIQTYRGETHLFELNEQLIQGLREIAKSTETSLYRIMLAAFFVLLYRYTHQEDILVGSPMAGRWSREEFKEIVGYFASPTVLRTIIRDSLTFKDFLVQVSTQVKEAQKHQDYPFPLLVEKLQPQRDPSRSPLFQVSFTWQKQRWCEPETGLGLKMEPYPLGHQRGASFDLDVMMMEMGEVLLAGWQYNTDLFDGATITRMAEHYQTLLEAIALNPEQRISELPLLTPAERHQLLVEWNNTWAEYPQDKCIHQLFEEQVERTPDAIAVVFEEKQLTYRELNVKANQLAHYLRSLGVRPEVLVGICVERSLEMIIGLLGILKAGGAYVPLDPNYPSERLAFMLEDSSVPVLLSQEKLLEKLPQHSACVVCLDSEWQKIAVHSKENPSIAVKPKNLAYVIYTSGSTGKPKGVLIQHESLVNYTTVASAEYEIDQYDRILQFSSISFDVSAEEIYTSLTSGATLVLRTDTMLDSIEGFLQKCKNWEITVMALPTAYWYELTAFLSQKTVVLPPSLRLIIIGGEKALPERLKTWLGCVEQRVRLVNNYGPTEATVGATIYDLSVADTTLKELPIGRPLGNVQTYILDGNRQPVPIGIPGELHIGGAGLARGYLNRPDLTDERFIPNPFSNEPGERLYKTGDLARYLPDGNIEFIGRIDNQVKIRGFRIELGEIETAISQHPLVKEAVVIATENNTGNKQIVAYISLPTEVTPNISDLRHFLKQKLPDYMIPAAFVMLDNLPLTPTGKVDRRALPSPELRPDLELTFVSPRTPIEEILASIWACVLGIEQVGVHDNFFELGGHSLLATQVISRVCDTMSVELPLRSLFEAPTIAELASRVEIALKNGKSVEALPLLPIPRSESIPLSFAQTRLWFLDRLQPYSAFYNIPLALRLFGQLNIAALQSSINAIIQRHEALRTNFAIVGDQPVQVIASTLNFQLEVVNLLHLSESQREIKAKRLATVEANRPFNLEQEPLLRGTVLQLGETEYLLLLTMHHIISDGWSLGVFIRELTELYQAFCTGKPPVLPELPVQYADFALWQRQWLTGEILETQLDYWKEQLKNAPNLLELPTDRPRPPVQTFRGGYYHAVLPQELSAELTTLSKRAGVTMFMTLLAAFQTLLYRYSGQDDIVVGTPVAGRNRQEIERLIGFFVNTLVLRTDLSDNPTFEQLLNRVREVALQAYANQYLPFEQLVEALQPTRDLSYTPLFQVMFALDNALVPFVELPDLTASSYSVEIGTAKFDLTLSMENTVDGLVGVWEYNADLFNEVTIARIAGHFQTLLEAIAVNPIQPISELPLLTQRERYQLLIEGNNTTIDYPQDKCIHQLFEEQVALTPDAVALVFKGEQLTYGELNRRANKLAHYLQSLGVGPEVLVGICVERSFDMIVGLLGILKAGGAYVPIDPAYPTDRIAYMLDDSRLPVLLTQKQLAASLPEHQAWVVCLDSDWQEISTVSGLLPITDLTPENLAYVIYTSGSTGKPKGVKVAHRGLCNLVQTQIKLFDVQPDSRVLQFASISFDASIWEIIMALCTGGHLYLGTQEELQPGPALLQLLQEQKITHANLVPSVLAALPDDELPALQNIVVGGEECPSFLVERWAKGRRFFNLYGPTESTVCATISQCFKGTGLPSIGRPLANIQIYILDRHKQPVPIGVSGELHIAGLGLARGYLNRPELTQEKFIPNPFSHELGSRLYKTGDLARYLPDGNIEYLGRIDNQVKIRGFRIELGEIEAILNQHPGVRETTVIAKDFVAGDKQLVAYVVAQQEGSPTITDLRDFLKQKLPNYMVPGAFVVLEALPLTPNGKVDRKSLPAPDLNSLIQKADFVAPRTPTEELLASIWAKVLGVEKVSINDNFFESGGHSLLATQLLSKVSHTFGLNLPLSKLFEAPTVADISSYIEAITWATQNIETTSNTTINNREEVEF
ncbi:amino acid adenylation domain-containing protein [Microcoleus sp. B4-C5]|uniref:amino acid adenylation domain-containing protein n=1 Tax=unclassified Microcoleus TaxID=2642155 RepID=UPI002FD03796